MIQGEKLQLLSFVLCVSDLLETSEILTTLFIKLKIDIGNNSLNTWNDNVLKGIDSAVCDFQSVIKSHELRLQGCDSDQDLEELCELLTSSQNSGTTSGKTEERVIITLLLVATEREDWKMDTGNIVSMHVQSNRCLSLDMVSHSSAEVTSRELSASQSEQCFSEVRTHPNLSFDNLAQSFMELLLQSFGLLLQKRMTLNSAYKFDLKDLQVPKRGELI